MLGMEDAWLLPAIPAAAFAVLALFRNALPRKGDWLGIAAILASFLLFFPVLADALDNLDSLPFIRTEEWFAFDGFQVNLGIYVDQLTLVMLAVVTFVALMVNVYSVGYMHGDQRYGWFYAVLALFAASMLTLVLSSNLLLLYVAWELVGFCSFLLIGFWWERRSAAEASKKAFVTTRVGDVGLLIGIIMLWRAAGTFEIQGIFEAIEAGEIGETYLTAALLLMFLGAMGKSAQVPLHVWLPDAMEGPTPVSALIHAATMVVAGVYLVARMLPAFEAVPSTLDVVLVVGTVTTLFAALVGLVQTDIKRVIAYSTINSLGLMFVALGAGSVTAAMLYLFVHGYFKALLFLGSGSVIHATERQDVNELGGLAAKMPITTWTFVLGALAMAGIPPLSGFWAKDEIILATSERHVLVYGLILVSVVLTALYMTRLTILTFFNRPRDHHVQEHAHESPPVMAVPLLLLAALTVVSGFVVFGPVGEALGLGGGFGEFVYFEHPHPFEVDAAVTAASILLALVGVGLGFAFFWGDNVRRAEALKSRFQPVWAALYHKFYFDELYQTLIDRVVLVLSAVVAQFDREVVNDTGVDGTAALTGYAGYRLKFQQTGRLPNYALLIVLGVIVLAIIAFATQI